MPELYGTAFNSVFFIIFVVFITLWNCRFQRFHPKVRLLSEDEYFEQSRLETRKALDDLRQFSRSPDCNAWKTMSRLKDPLRYLLNVVYVECIYEKRTRLTWRECSYWRFIFVPPLNVNSLFGIRLSRSVDSRVRNKPSPRCVEFSNTRSSERSRRRQSSRYAKAFFL